MSSFSFGWFARPLWAMGFRPFFLLAGLSAFTLMALWLSVLQFGVKLPSRIPVPYWHGHEMLYGYSMAVIAGFLLTAVRNWTGKPTLSGAPLATLALLWALPRILLPFSLVPVLLIALLDLLFSAVFLFAIVVPVFAAGQMRRQMEVLLSVVLLMLLNAAFYGEVLSWINWGYGASLSGGLYAALYLVLVVGRRIIPLFTERGVGYQVTLRNNDLLDRLCTLTFLLFALADVLRWDDLKNIFAFNAAVVHAYRWWGWQTTGIYKKPLLWVLHVGYGLIITGFFLAAFNVSGQWSDSLILHLFALGGVALITMGMMARVALGHTGRNVHQAPAIVTWIQIILLLVIAARVVLPLMMPGLYAHWIQLGQLAWLVAAGLFVRGYWVVLTGPRADGLPG